MKRLWAGLAAGFALALAWFLHLSKLDLGQRLRGDAGGYLRIAASFQTWSDAFDYVADRAVAFPLVIRTFVLMSPPLNEAAGVTSFLSIASVCLFVFHVFAVVVFVWALRRRYPSLHWFIGVVLLGYPALVAHTTVPLTDTFTADLVMLALAVLASSDHLGASVGAGTLLALAALCRPSYNPAVIASLSAATVIVLAVSRSWRPAMRPAILLAAYLLALLPASLHCRSKYGQLCLFDPRVGQDSLDQSLTNGLDSPRLYWTAMVAPNEQNPTCGPGCRTLRDPMLSSTWAEHCHIDKTATGFGLPRCFLTRPDLGVFFLAKKSLALFDSYQYQDYAVDLTPKWARLWSRPFSATAYAGFIAGLAGLVVLVWRKKMELPLLVAFLLSATLVLVHSMTHIEGRYGYGAIPGALLAFFLGWNVVEKRRAVRIALVLCAGLFFLQTAAWDSLDVVLQRIEARL